MGRVKLAPEEEIADLQRKAVEKQTRLQTGLIRQALQAHPHCVPHLVSTLQGLKILDSSGLRLIAAGGDAAQFPLSYQAQALQTQREAKKAATASDSVQNSSGKDWTEREFAGKYWTLGTLGLDTLQSIAEAIEPASLSKANTRKLTVRGQPTTNKLEITKILELATGMDPEFGLVGAYRVPKNLIAEMVRRSQERGRRVADLILPLNMHDHGLYSISYEGGAVTLCHKYLKESQVVPASELPKHAKGFFIECNWSESRAAIKCVENPQFDLKCSRFFPDQRVLGRRGVGELVDGSRFAKKARTAALQDEAAPMPGGTSAPLPAPLPAPSSPMALSDALSCSSPAWEGQMLRSAPSMGDFPCLDQDGLLVGIGQEKLGPRARDVLADLGLSVPGLGKEEASSQEKSELSSGRATPEMAHCARSPGESPDSDVDELDVVPPQAVEG